MGDAVVCCCGAWVVVVEGAVVVCWRVGGELEVVGAGVWSECLVEVGVAVVAALVGAWVPSDAFVGAGVVAVVVAGCKVDVGAGVETIIVVVVSDEKGFVVVVVGRGGFVQAVKLAVQPKKEQVVSEVKGQKLSDMQFPGGAALPCDKGTRYTHPVVFQHFADVFCKAQSAVGEMHNAGSSRVLDGVVVAVKYRHPEAVHLAATEAEVVDVALVNCEQKRFAMHDLFCAEK